MKKSPLKLKKYKKDLEYEIDESINNIIFLNKYIKKNHFLYEAKKEILNLNKEKGFKKYIKNILNNLLKKEKNIIENCIEKNKLEIIEYNRIVRFDNNFKELDINEMINNIEKVASETIKNICLELKKRYLLENDNFYKYIFEYANFTHDKNKKEAIGIIIKNITEIIK